MQTNIPRALVLSAFAVLSLWIQRACGADGEKDFIWQVTSESGGEVYLLGSIHLGKKDWYPLPKEIEDAFEKSKFLVVEVDNTKADQAKIIKILGEKGMYPLGDSISKHVSKETNEKINTYFENSGQPAVGATQMRPWMLSVMIGELEMKKLGFDENEGIDRHFLTEANVKTKSVLELESMDAQLDLMSGFDNDLQEKMLLSTIEEMADMKTNLPKMIEAWQKGDTKGLEELDSVTKHPEFKPLMKKIFEDRNVGMVEKIEGYLKTKDPHFVVVGAGHLVGEKGIIKLLEVKKYKVEQLAKLSSSAAKEKEPLEAGKATRQ